MGLLKAIHDTVAAADLQKAANEINDCFLHGMMPYLNKYAHGEKYSNQDWGYIKAGIDFIAGRVSYMQNRLQDLIRQNGCLQWCLQLMGIQQLFLDILQQCNNCV